MLRQRQQVPQSQQRLDFAPKGLISCRGEDDSNGNPRVRISPNKEGTESLCQAVARQRLFLKGGEGTLAISKEKKNELVDQYGEWIDKSQTLILTEYIGLTMKDMDELRGNIRDIGGEFHIIKNTLSKLAFDNAGLSYSDDIFEGTTAISFAFDDPPALAKAMTDYAKSSDFLKIKGGYLEKEEISVESIKSLAELPPLPVLRAQLLSMIMSPASKLAMTLAEPGRQIAAVIKAHAEPEPAG
jgi:large subunit ribosomal protein L10